MKKYYSILLIAMALLFSIASCQKNDESLVYDNEIETSGSNTLLRGDDDQISLNDPVLMAHLDSLYGDNFYICDDSLRKATLSFHKSSGPTIIKFWIFPFKYSSGVYLTVVHISNTQILGVYVQTYYLRQNNGTNSTSYEFLVSNPDTFGDPYLFLGVATISYLANHPDTLNVSNINIPTTYLYPLFDNITSGNVTLNVPLYGSNAYSQIDKMTLRVASTVYLNYCGS